MSKRIELYGANLHVGGAVNTTASLVDGVLAGMAKNQYAWVDSLEIIVSPAILRAMSRLSETYCTDHVILTERYDSPLASLTRFSGDGLDLRYVFFGPDYLWSNARVNVLGFADGTVIPATSTSPGNLGLHPLNQRLTHGIRKELKRLLLAKYDGFVVQTAAMADSLAVSFPNRPIAVVPNLLAPAFVNPQLRRGCDLPKREYGEVRLAFPAKGYPHKNHVLLPRVAREFKRLTGKQLTFVVTLETSEYVDVFREDDFGIINLGPLPAAMIPGLFEQTDGLFFPSLNETFSSAPLEAAFMERPIIVSDLPYARDSLSGFATFFDPFDPCSGAQAIAMVNSGLATADPQLLAQMIAAREWSLSHANPEFSANTLMRNLRMFAEGSLYGGPGS